MKKILSVILILTLIFPLAACSISNTAKETTTENQSSQNTSDSQAPSKAKDETDSNSKKILVAYFSASGNTEKVAAYISEASNADVFEITPKQPYTQDDLKWTDKNSRVNAEHDDESKRDVELSKTTPNNFNDYDVVFIGYPIWWGIAAWPVNNFVKNSDFSGKTVIPFCTSASSGLGQSSELLKEMASTGTWLEGKRFQSNASESSVADWVNSLEF